jgi:hypothetical protein
MNSYDRVRVARKRMEMAYDVTDQDKAATVPKMEVMCAAAVSWVIAARVKTTIAVSISMAIMFAVVITREVAAVMPKSPPSIPSRIRLCLLSHSIIPQVSRVICLLKKQIPSTQLAFQAKFYLHLHVSCCRASPW